MAIHRGSALLIAVLVPCFMYAYAHKDVAYDSGALDWDTMRSSIKEQVSDEEWIKVQDEAMAWADAMIQLDKLRNRKADPEDALRVANEIRATRRNENDEGKEEMNKEDEDEENDPDEERDENDEEKNEDPKEDEDEDSEAALQDIDDEQDAEEQDIEDKERQDAMAKPFWRRRRRSSRRRRRRRRWSLPKVRLCRRRRRSCSGVGCTIPAGKVNGCGGKGQEAMTKILPFSGPLKCACDKHDVCYWCYKFFGVSRLSCDYTFLVDQRTLCKKRYHCWTELAHQHTCLRMAYAQYAVVVTAGWKFAAKTAPAWCNNSCIKSKYHPNTKLT